MTVVTLANANNTLEKEKSVFENEKLEMVTILEKMNLVDYNNYSQVLLDEGCGEKGNKLYTNLRADGMSHREARSERRAAVRECRNLPEGGWLPIAGEWAIKIASLFVK